MQALSADSTLVDIRIKIVVAGPSKMVKCYKGHMINGLRFHTKESGGGRKTMNSGVRVKGSCGDNHERDFFGMLMDIVELSYIGGMCITLFKCHCYDSENHLRVNKYGIIDINYKSSLASDEPFILASQANQVYYAPYATRTRELHDWWAVLNIKPRSTYNISMPQQRPNDEQYVVDDIYQEDNMSTCNVVEGIEEAFELRGVGEEIILDSAEIGEEEKEEFEEGGDGEEDESENGEDEEDGGEGDDEDEENRNDE